VYGPTETTIVITVAPPTEPGERLHIGPPIDGVDLLVLDARLRPVPVGVAGELYVSGPALARGYLERRGLTAERFVANPFGAPGDRIYRTGDVVRWARDRDGSLSVDYVGRSDDQIKLRGLRIELGEIESALGDHPAVASAVVVGVDSDGGLAASGQSVVAALAAYVVLRDAVDIATLREHLADRLPLFMVPAGIVVLDALPLTPVGKLDRRALPAPTIEVDSDHVDAETPVEQQLATIVAGLLGLERVSVTDSFFALGGDSIMSIQVASAARAAGIDVSPRDIFEHKTVRAIARAVGGRGERVPALEEPAGGGIGPMAVPPVVSWILDQTDEVTDFADFSQSMVLTAPAGLTVEIAQELLAQVVSVHPMLSAAVEPGQSDGEWLMRTGVAPLRPGAVTALASPALVGDPGFSDTVVAAFEDASRRLDPTTGQLVAAVLVTDPDAAARLVVVIHHLGVDAVSWRVIIEDLLTAWAQHEGGEAFSLRPEVTSARAFTAALAAQRAGRADELSYWLERSPERVTDLGAEVDRARDRMSTTETVVHTVGSSVTEALLTSVPTAFRGNVNDALVAALARAVRSWQQARGIADDRPVTILLEGHGRYEETLLRGTDPRTVDLSRTVGWFTTIAPMAVDVRGDAVHTVKLAKEERVGQPDNRIGYGLLRYGDTELSRRPLPSIGFNYLGNVTGAGAGGQNAPAVGEAGMPFLPDPTAPRLPGTVTGAMVVPNLLSINAGTAIGDSGREFVAGFTFPRGAIDTEAVDDLARRWDAELATIVDEIARVGDPGLSPSDVLGARVTQDDLDHLARRYPGADVWPLSPLQRGLQFQAELAAAGREAGAVDVYTAQAVLTLKGDVDATRLAEAVREVFARHRVLRSSFVRVPSGEVVAVVPETVEIPWRTVDADSGDEAIAAVAQVERATPFDLESGPLMRFVLVRSGTRSTLVVTSHHILIDGWSSPLIMADLFALYATGQTYTGTVAAESGAGGDYFDYLRYIAASDTEAGLAAWRSVLSAVDEPTLVGSGREATSDQLPRDHSVLLPAEITSAVEDLTRARGVTVSTVMQFAWAVLLSRITGQRTVVFGETVSGRPADLDGVETMVGLFINTLPAVADVDPGARAADVLDALQASKVAVLDHQHLGLPELTALVGRGQLFDTLAVHESYPVDAQSLKQGADAGGIGIEDLDATDSTHYPLNLVTGVVGDQIELKLKYLPAAFDERQVQVYSDALIRILTTLVADPATEVGSISLLDDAEYRSGLTPPVTRTRNTDVPLAELFTRAARAHADRPAVTDTTSTLDYRELDERSAAVAAALRARGVSTGDLVAVATSRGVDLVSSILGVLRSGAGYLPLDTTNPVDRLGFIVSDAAPSAVIIDDTTADFGLWSRLGTTPVVPVAQLVAEGAAASPEPVTVHPDSRAYVIYTSGSTGRPKGVEVTHRDVVTLMDTAADDFDVDETDVWTMFHSYAFDFSVWELWGPLLTGGRLVLVDRDLARAPEEFLDLLSRERVTVLSQTPSAFYQLAEARRRREAALSLRYIVFGGEALSFEQVRRWFDDHPGESTSLVNMYGITETTVHVSFRPLDPQSVTADDASFIGRPLSSLAIHVLDDRLRPVPEGIVGEMYVTGGQLAQGYLKRAGLSSTRFVASPYGGPGARMYRTGDLARRVGDDIEYLGRGDAQVQLRGYRIEFGEIEAALLAVPGVSAAAARVVDIPGRGEQLIGYLVRTAENAVDTAEVRRIAGRAVPSYMIPDQIVDLETLPLTANGKLDREALPAPDSATVVEDVVAPAGPQETAVAQVFAEVLGVDEIGVTTSFFDLGGNSLSATRLASRVADALGTEVSVRDVFEAPSVRDLVAAVSGRGASLPPVVAVSPRPDRIPLSFAQQRLWFINRFEPASSTYNIPIGLRLRGPVDAEALHAAVEDLVVRQAVLRTTFPDVEGVPYQRIHGRDEVDRLDWAIVDSQEHLETAITSGFDVTVDWPIRARLWPVAADEFVFVVVVHHIAADGESMKPMLADLITAYGARVSGQEPEYAELEVEFADYALWQHDVFGSAGDPDSLIAAQLDHWTSRLAGTPDVLELPTDRPRPPVASQRGARFDFDIPAPVGDAIERVASERGVTPFMVVHAALTVLLARLSATDDIVVGTPIAGRGKAALDALVGMFVNTLVLRVPVAGEENFEALLDRVRTIDLDAFANSDVPFETLVEALNPVRTESFAPLAQVNLTFDQSASADFAIDAEQSGSIGDLDFEPLPPAAPGAKVDLNFAIDRGDDGRRWAGSVIYATDLFDESTIDALTQRLVAVLQSVLATPSRPVGDVDLVLPAEAARLQDFEAGPRAEVGAPDTVADLVSAWAAATPDVPAVIYDDRVVDGAEFGARVSLLARELIDAGVGPDAAVGVCLDRSVEIMVAVHAIVAAGGQYVPIDPESPVERSRYILETARVATVVTGPGDTPDALAEFAGRIVRADSTVPLPDAPVPPVTGAERLGVVHPDNAVYTIFTSGSTGRPKGVTVTHGALRNTLAWFSNSNGEGAHRFLMKTPYTFDASVWEFFGPVFNRSAVVVAEPGGHRDPRYLAGLIERHGVTSVKFVPSMLAAFLDGATGAGIEKLATLRRIFSGGEALLPGLATGLATELPDALLVNQYGPTEAVVDITYGAVTDPSAQNIPIGTPVWNSSVHVLDARLRPVPVGVAGELYLGGVQLARGYASRSGLTAETFVADPFGPAGARLYRTGDRGRWNANGELEYLGRNDFQVKLRGQRIELGEIESILGSAPGVVHTAVVVSAPAGGGEQLVAYLAGGPGVTPDLDTVKDLARRGLPQFMVPTTWMVLDQMPLTTSGKVDRRALPTPDVSQREVVAPANDIEAAVAEAFSGLLGVDDIGVTESFFDIGGTSLSAMRLAARVSDVLGVEVSVRDIFDAPTVRELVAGTTERDRALPPVVAVSPRPQRIPLSFAQQRMWFINQFDPTLPTYNIPTVVRLAGDLDVPALQAAIADVVARHDVLHTTFPQDEQGPYQLISDASEVASRLDFSIVSTAEEFERTITRGFDVSAEWPVRACLWPAEDDTHILGLIAHHIAFDGESRKPLVADLVAAYVARSAGEVQALAPLDVQFADFAIWQHDVLGSADDPESVLGRQLAHWTERLTGLPDVLELPTDHARPAVASARGGRLGFEIPAEVADAVAATARTHGVTPFMVVHAALAVLLARLSATDDIAIATPVAGRGSRVLDPLVGMFVNTLVLRSRIAPEMSVDELLAQVRGTDLDAFTNADIPFETLVEHLDPIRSEAFAPLAQVLLTLGEALPAGPGVLGEDAAAGAAELPGLAITPVEPPEVSAQLDLAVAVSVGAAGQAWSGSVIYALDLFEAGTVAGFADRLVSLLRDMTGAGRDTVAVGDLALVSADDRARVDGWSVGETTVFGSPVIADAVAARIAEDPTQVAIDFEGRRLTYGEFGSRVADLARTLIGLGIGPEVAVGVCIDRSVEMVVAVHAVLAAGGQYVPIDTAAPADRVQYMIETARVAVVLSAGDARPEAIDGLDDGITLVQVDAMSAVADTAPVTDADRLAPLRGDHAAYTLFTSGSTGRPKGVTVSHASVMNRLWWGLGEFPWTVGDRIVQKTPYTFDVSVPELFGPLISGATMIVARPGGHTDPDYLVDLISSTRATSVHFVPSMMSIFLDLVPAGRFAEMSALRWVFASGEALPPAVVAKLHALLPQVSIVNLFGPTEAAVEVAVADVSTAPAIIPIGVPVANTSTWVLDARLRPVPAGVPGELYLGGVQLARGYAARADLSAERFVADPFGEPGSRLYRTGDLVRWRADGTLEYLGRTDFQVKLRGQRIELGEIESVIATVEGVVHTAVTVAKAPTGADHLVGYVAPEGVDLDLVKSTVAAELPEYMRPTVWMTLPYITLNSAGKIDRKALPEPEFGVHTEMFVAPATTTEEVLASIVAHLIGIPRVSVTESFFALGGDSIMSIQLASAARAAGVDLSPREIFEHRTIRGMAAAADDDAARLPMLEESSAGTGPVTVSPVVHWMIEHASAPSDFADFVQAAVLRAPDGLDVERLIGLLAAVVDAHPMLTATLAQTEDGWRSTVGNAFDGASAVIEVSSVAAVGTDEFDSDVRTAFGAVSATLDPEAGQLVRAALIRDRDGVGRVLLVIHHLGVDAVSWPILIEDLITGWAQLSDGRDIELRAEQTSARAWTDALAARTESWHEQRDHWLEQLPPRPTPLGVTLDRTRDLMSTERHVSLEIGAPVTRSVLTAVPEAFGGNVSDVLLGAFARAVRSWQSRREITDSAPVTVLTEGHGRYEEVLAAGESPRRADLSRSVGWFTTIVPVRLDPGTDVVHAVKAAKEARLAQPDNGIGFGWLRYGSGTADPDSDARELATRPLPSISFNYFGAGGGAGAPDAEVLPFTHAPDAPILGSSASGRMVALSTLGVSVTTSLDEQGNRKLVAGASFPGSLFADDEVTDLLDMWAAELAALTKAIGSGTRVGLSPSDVPGTGVTQRDLDDLARTYPGAAVWPLTPLQQGLYFQAQLAASGQESGAVDVYVTQVVLTLGGRVDGDRLRGSAEQLFARHRVMRSAYLRTGSGAVVAVIPERVEIPWRVVRLDSGVTAEDADAEIRRIVEGERLARFDLGRPPLVRFVLVWHDDQAHLVVTNHHILMDGWSGPLVLADLLALYATGETYTGQVAGGEGSQRSDFADHVRRLAAADRDAGLAAWRQVLAPIEGPTLVAPGLEATDDELPRQHRVMLDEETTAGLEELTRTEGVTTATVMQFAWSVLLSRMTGNRVVVFGETVSGRPADLPGVETMVGLFINTLPSVVDVDPAATIVEVLRRLQAAKVAVMDHQHLGLSDLTALAGSAQLFDTLTVHESFPIDTEALSSQDATEGLADGLVVADVDSRSTTHYPINLITAAAGGRVSLQLKYLPAAFGDDQIRVFGEILVHILETVARTPHERTSDIPLVSTVDGLDVAEWSRGHEVQIPGEHTVVDLVADARARAADRPAVLFDDRVVHYDEFAARVSILARELISLGVGPDVAVGVCIDRSVEVMVAVHAIVAAGGQYVPIDTESPVERTQYMIDTADVAMVLIGTERPEALAGVDLPVVVVDASAPVDTAVASVSDADRPVRVLPDHAVYTIFTSGSTGRPKG
ncbi:amino acid adenylation domain-containing protein, partial [Gordonia terrae]